MTTVILTEVRDSMLQAWEKWRYGEFLGTFAWLTAQAQMSSDAQSSEDLVSHLTKVGTLEMLQAQPGVVRALEALRRSEHPMRGSQLLRDAVLLGCGDVEPGLAVLVEAGAVLVAPPAGRRTWSLEEDVSRRSYLRRDLWMPESLLKWWAQESPFEGEIQVLPVGEGEEIRSEESASIHELELDLLHLSSVLAREALVLNKDGTPNRRSLARAVRGLSLVQRWTPPGTERPDIATPVCFERLFFLMGLGKSLGVLVEEGPSLGVPEHDECDYFTLPRGEREAALLKAWRNMETWDEHGAWAVLHGDADPESRGVLDQSRTNALAGPRGQMLEDLGRLPLGQWVWMDVLVDMMLALDRGYFTQVLQGKPPRIFVEAVLRLSLPWLGMLEFGVGPLGRGAVKWTETGARALGRDGKEEKEVVFDPLAVKQRPPPFVVQPNLEITCFVDDAMLADLAILYQVSVRVKRTDRSAVFALRADTVQRAYSRGMDADKLVAFLGRTGRTPLPQSVEFTLRDWERVHGRIVLSAHGALIEHQNPDKLDVLMGTLEHFWKNEEPMMRLGDAEVYLPGVIRESEARGLEIGRMRVFDYSKTPGERAPCLRHVEDLSFEVLPGGLDLITEAQLPSMARQEGDLWIVEAERTLKSLGDDARHALVEFFSDRVEGELETALRLRLEALVTDDLHAEVQEGVDVLMVSSERVAEALMELADVDEWVARRLGPETFLLLPGGAEPVKEALRAIGLSPDAGE